MDPMWTPVLIEQMGSPNAAVRREAAEAAADYEDSVSALSELVDDPDRSVRLASIASLGTLAVPEARDVLVYCFESADPEIREAASRALQASDEPEAPLGSVDLGQYEEEES
ncbi:MAG TPA: HEAT repeat domain-containing protein, partial [Chloroflexota bacterium]|nr:HEAT repeat domain-containing protein [Chloroflexota bacterium]